MNERGKCRLCNAYERLVEGHLIPSFVYKRTLADQKTGGSFVDLPSSRLTNRQLKYRWFCAQCDNQTLGGLERQGALFYDLCREDSGHGTVPYDDRVHRFVTSYSWRVAMSQLENVATKPDSDVLRRASRVWKQYLKGYGSDIRPYSQHMFLVRSKPWDMAAGHEFVAKHRSLFSQLGPMFIVALLDRSVYTLHDIKVWEKSELRPRGGGITPLSAWRVGDDIPHASFEHFRLHVSRSIQSAGVVRL